MIDYQNQIYTAIATGLRESVDGITVTGSVSDDAPSFPCVQIEETNNVPIEIDNHEPYYAALTYRIRIWTNSGSSRIADARKILSVVDSIVEPMNFTRRTYVPQNGLYNNSAYRIDTTYAVAVDADGRLHKRK